MTRTVPTIQIEMQIGKQKKRTNYAKITEIPNKNTFRFVFVSTDALTRRLSLIRLPTSILLLFLLTFFFVSFSSLILCLFGPKLYIFPLKLIEKAANKCEGEVKRNRKSQLSQQSKHKNRSFERTHIHTYSYWVVNFLHSITSIIYGCGSFRHIMPSFHCFFLLFAHNCFSLRLVPCKINVLKLGEYYTTTTTNRAWERQSTKKTTYAKT